MESIFINCKKSLIVIDDKKYPVKRITYGNFIMTVYYGDNLWIDFDLWDNRCHSCVDNGWTHVVVGTTHIIGPTVHFYRFKVVDLDLFNSVSVKNVTESIYDDIFSDYERRSSEA